MIRYSIGVQLAWEISSYEAANKKSAQIETDHIMLGILSMGKIQERVRVNSEQKFEKFFIEKEKLYKILYSYKLNPTTLRRTLREMLPNGNGLPSDNVFRRSRNYKQLFVEASGFSNNYLTIKHLFLAIANRESSHFHKLLIALKINIEELKSEIMFSFYKQN